MKIIRPLTNIVSSKVKNWKQIRSEALELREFLKAKDFDGYWQDAFAISHTQVCKEPKNFFVVHDQLIKKFGHWCIINLKIIKKSKPCTFPEGCMSFPFRKEKRVDRFAEVLVLYYVPVFNLFLIPKWKKFKNLEAFICQHEFDHSKGENIYGL